MCFECRYAYVNYQVKEGYHKKLECCEEKWKNRIELEDEILYQDHGID